MFSPKEIAYKLKTSYKTIIRLIKRGDLIAYKIGRHYKITQQDLDYYLESTRSN